MKGLDTNILLWYVTEDDPAQFAAASEFLLQAELGGERLFVNVIVLCELAWTLRGGRYRFERSAIASVIEKLLDIPLFEIQSRDLVRLALPEYRNGSADFSDYLIGQQNLAVGCSDTVTFDTHLVDSDAFHLLRR